MKILSIVSIVIGLLALVSGVYNQMEFVPLCESDNLPISMFREVHDQKNLWGYIAMFPGILAVILGVIAGIKKNKLGWIGAGLGLVTFFLGASQCTHMF